MGRRAPYRGRWYALAVELIEIPGGWRLWSVVGLRGAGFPVTDVDALADLRLHETIQQWLSAAEAAEAARSRAFEAARSLEREANDEEEKRAYRRILKRLKKGTAPKDAPESLRTVVTAMSEETSRAAQLLNACREAFDAADRAIADAIRALASRPLFREALLRQNPAALGSAVEKLKGGSAMDSKARQHRELVASYVQRYATKNDTISFFGPVAWSTLVPDEETGVRPGPDFLASRTTFFEHWAVDAVAAKLSEDEDLLPFLAPRRNPRVRVEGTTLHFPIDRTTELDELNASVLARCDGLTPAAELFASFGEEEVREALELLLDEGLIQWRLEVPTNTQRPDRLLRERVEALPASEPKRRAVTVLDALERARARVETASGVDELRDALGALDAGFTERTGLPPQRLAGQTYAGRNLTYEDCRRDVEVDLGQQVVDAARAPLALLLASARWYTHEIAQRYRAAFGEMVRSLTEQAEVVDYQRFWAACRPLFPEEGSITDEVVRELSSRWAEILEIDPSARRIDRRAEDLVARVEAAFQAPGPGWPAARHHAPDLMIAAPSAEAIRRGELLLVMGELHPALNTVTNPFMLEQSTAPEVLVAQREADLPEPCIAAVWSKARNRADYFSVSRHDYDLQNGAARSARPPEQVVDSAELVVTRTGRVRTRDGRLDLDLIAFAEKHLIAEAHGRFSIARPDPHLPRITIDRLVVARESWEIAPEEIQFAHEKDRFDRFLQTERWARALGLPRRVFFKIPEETKPHYLDFASPILVDLFLKQARRASRISVSEMLPGPEDCWLVDAAGARYTSELRVAAVDPVPYSVG